MFLTHPILTSHLWGQNLMERRMGTKMNQGMNGKQKMVEFFMPMVPPECTHQEKKVRVVNGKPVFYEPENVKAARSKLTAHLAKSRACIVGDLILRENAARDLGGKRRERLQAGKHGFQGIFRCIFGFVPCASGPGFDTQRRLKKTADTKQFFNI